MLEIVVFFFVNLGMNFSSPHVILPLLITMIQKYASMVLSFPSKNSICMHPTPYVLFLRRFSRSALNELFWACLKCVKRLIKGNKRSTDLYARNLKLQT